MRFVRLALNVFMLSCARACVCVCVCVCICVYIYIYTYVGRVAQSV